MSTAGLWIDYDFSVINDSYGSKIIIADSYINDFSSYLSSTNCDWKIFLNSLSEQLEKFY